VEEEAEDATEAFGVTDGSTEAAAVGSAGTTDGCAVGSGGAVSAAGARVASAVAGATSPVWFERHFKKAIKPTPAIAASATMAMTVGAFLVEVRPVVRDSSIPVPAANAAAALELAGAL
jgi:hypothetical protein